jgi:hypothetical protein
MRSRDRFRDRAFNGNRAPASPAGLMGSAAAAGKADPTTAPPRKPPPRPAGIDSEPSKVRFKTIKVPIDGSAATLTKVQSNSFGEGF